MSASAAAPLPRAAEPPTWVAPAPTRLLAVPLLGGSPVSNITVLPIAWFRSRSLLEGVVCG